MKKIVLCFLAIVFLSFNAKAKEISLECVIGENEVTAESSILLDTDKMTAEVKYYKYGVVRRKSPVVQLFSKTDTYFFTYSEYDNFYESEYQYEINRTDFSFWITSRMIDIEYNDIVMKVTNNGTCKVIEDKNVRGLQLERSCRKKTRNCNNS